MTRPQPRKVARLIAAPLAAALALGLAACAPITTLKPYAASDGVRVVVSDDVVIENLMIISAAEGSAGAIQGGIRNDGANTSVVIGSETIDVESGETLLLGGENGLETIIDPVTVAPGATLKLDIAATGTDVQNVPVPVLDGTLPEYAPYIPQ